jgi:hypothetical protein
MIEVARAIKRQQGPDKQEIKLIETQRCCVNERRLSATACTCKSHAGGKSPSETDLHK